MADLSCKTIPREGSGKLPLTVVALALMVMGWVTSKLVGRLQLA